MEFIKYEERGYIGILTVDRPKALNALNTAVLKELEDAIAGLDLCRLRCLIVTGAGEKAFVAGADISEMKDFDPKQALEFSAYGNLVFKKLEELPIPVIAAVNGFALGGGCELSLSCDIRLCSQNAVFGQPETSLGITPGFGGTQRLARIIGTPMAKELIYTSRKVKAPEALALGLVSQVVPQEELMEAALALGESIAKNVPMAVRQSKMAINQGVDGDLAAGLALEVTAFSNCFTTQDRLNAMTAFVEKRKPQPFENK